MTLHPNHHRLWKLNTGLQETWATSFSSLPPDSRTLVSKWNTKLALIWKEDFGPLGNSPVLLLLAQVRRLWRQLYPNSLTLCVVLLMIWRQPQSIPREVHPNSWVDFAWDPHKAVVLSVGCASFSSTLFPSTQLSVNMLGYSTLWTASLVMNVCVFSSLWRVSMIVFWTTVRSAVFHMIVSPTEPNWETILKTQETFACVLSRLAEWHVTMSNLLRVNWWVFVKCEPKSSQLKEPKT